MGLFSTILTLPLAPVRLVVRFGELIQERVEQQLNDPAMVRRQLERIDDARAAGEITAEEQSEAEAAVLRPMTARRAAPLPGQPERE